MGQETCSPPCATWLPGSLTPFLLLFPSLFSSQFLFFLVKMPCYVLNFLLSLALSKYIMTEFSIPALWLSMLSMDLVPSHPLVLLLPVHLIFISHGQPLISVVLANIFAVSLFLEYLPFLLGRGPFCLFSKKERTDRRQRKKGEHLITWPQGNNAPVVLAVLGLSWPQAFSGHFAPKYTRVTPTGHTSGELFCF